MKAAVAGRKAHWERVYEAKPAEELSWHEEQPRVSMRMLRLARIGGEDAIIDVGAGASRFVDSLLLQGYRDVTVMDISESALSVSQERLQEKASAVDWLVADVLEFEPSRRFELWHDRAVFHFLTRAEDRRRYLDTLRKALGKGGHLLLATFALDGPDRCSGLPVERYDAAKLLAVLGGDFRLIEQSLETHITPAGIEQRFVYFLIKHSGAL